MTSKTTNKFSPELRARAVRMVLDHEGEPPSRWATIMSIAGKIGCTAQKLLGKMFAHWKVRSLDMMDRGFCRKILLQAQHELPVVFARFEARRMILERLPFHDQVEAVWGFNPLREDMTAITVRANQQWGDLREYGSEFIDVFIKDRE